MRDCEKGRRAGILLVTKTLLTGHSASCCGLFPDAGEAGSDDFSIFCGERDFEGTGGGDD